ncbi:MAG: hypothetical protein JOZ48_08555 [Acidobacteriaceae bacterium]|nr:hypothetical protein [Acidobacteriaceae bacterium]
MPGYSAWLLKIKLNDEWEECKFSTRKEALAAFIALATDYKAKIKKAVLFSPTARARHAHSKKGFETRMAPQPKRKFNVN